MKRLIFALLLSVFLFGCGTTFSTTPYVPPQECIGTTDSLILEKFPDPRLLDKGLLTTNFVALKTIKGYDASDGGLGRTGAHVFP